MVVVLVDLGKNRRAHFPRAVRLGDGGCQRGFCTWRCIIAKLAFSLADKLLSMVSQCIKVRLLLIQPRALTTASPISTVLTLVVPAL